MTQSNTAVFPSIENEIRSFQRNYSLRNAKPYYYHLLILFKRKLARTSPTQLYLYTHSRRSHLSQVWAQTAAAHFNVKMFCYSGGTEATALFPWQNIGTSRIRGPPLSEGKTQFTA
jgi:arsenate reductase